MHQIAKTLSVSDECRPCNDSQSYHNPQKKPAAAGFFFYFRHAKCGKKERKCHSALKQGTLICQTGAQIRQNAFWA